MSEEAGTASLLKNKMTAYVTGADRGLGLALVRVLLDRSFTVYAGSYLSDRHGLEELRTFFPEQLHILSLDVTNEQSVLRAARMIGETSDSLNLLVNNAGDARERSQTISDPMYFDDMLRLYDINALGALRVCHSVMSLLLNAATKTLVNVSSLAASIGTVTRTNQYGYTMSKAALNMQSKLIHNHHKQSGLRVLAVHPGWMRTNIFGDISRMKDAPFEPIQAAENIVKLVESPPNADDAIFCDAQGHPMSW